MNKNTVLSKDIINAVSLFAEFGSRNGYEKFGKIIITNDVNNPKAEGIYLARLARIVYRKTNDVTKAYDFAMKAFTDNIYNRNEKRNVIHLSKYDIVKACK